MKKGINKHLMRVALTLGFLALVGCFTNTKPVVEQTTLGADDKTEVVEVNNNKVELPTGKYNEGIVLVKKTDFDKNMLGELQYKHVEQLYKNSPWQKVELKNKDKTSEAVEYLSSLNVFDKVEYDYIMGSDGTIESIDISGNPNSNEQDYLDAQGIFDGWGYQMANSMTPGGSPDVVVAVIDTGVDYNHIDLRNNIWTNSGEIPNNGIDDDGNGYVDDIHGWDCVGNDKDPMDDNGHGTHVAGIIAAENNTIGTVGIAFNCKVMCLKAGNSSGYFNNSDIVEAIRYAYMNGASVINMSFGGSTITTAVKEALEDAYNQCVLVAAAGNDCLCNNIYHIEHDTGISYPAALSYVIGVMSTNYNGTTVSAFSNYDHTPYNSIEYETYACGEQIPSTWPNNRIARLSGTSMASPVVAGIAAILRSVFSNREIYSNKYIQSQIVNTGSIHPYNSRLMAQDGDHSLANVYDALTKMPKPKVNLYDYYVFDNVEFDDSNNGNGVIEAGETIRMAIEACNWGGVASNAIATINTIRNGDPNLTDPYFLISKNTISLGEIGTYSIRDCEKVYEEGTLISTNKYFEFVVDESCPNDYKANFNISIVYSNGLDQTDLELYSSSKQVFITVSNGCVLPSLISENTIFDSNKLYILADNVVIPENVTVIFEEGCSIQFYSSRQSYGNSIIYNSPHFEVYGSLLFHGSKERIISIYPSDLYAGFACMFYRNSNAALIEMDYVDVTNLATPSIIPSMMGALGSFNIFNSNIFENTDYITVIQQSSIYSAYRLTATNIQDSYVCFKRSDGRFECNTINKSYIDICSAKNINMHTNTFTNNVLLSSASGNSSAIYASEAKVFNNNAIISSSDNDPRDVMHFDFSSCSSSSNYFSPGYKKYASQNFDNFYLNTGEPSIDIDGECSNYKLLFPFIKSIELFDKDNQPITTVGTDEFSIKITFSRPLETNYDLGVFFGSTKPFADYKINGSFVSDTIWEGRYTVKAFIENGSQFFRIKNGFAKDSDDGALKRLVDNSSLFSFNINTSSSLSMNLQAYASKNGIQLTWMQDDYDTLMGYNIYRSTTKDGNYVKLNNSVIPADENAFVDENAEPGVTYWYTFTVVFSDMTESAPAGKVSCTAADTIAPSIYHTPVNQGYLNNNLVISCTASDNIGIQSVTLYYRTKGQAEWKSLVMLKQNDRYSVTIFGSDLSLEGLEYYIVASDGVNTINKGSAENPYSVIIKDASAISQLGDVDGDGVITTKDALMIMQSINGDLLLTDDQFRRADLNKDNILSSVEALRILQYINGNIPTLEM